MHTKVAPQPHDEDPGRRRKAGTDTAGIRTIHVATRILVTLAEYREPVRVTDLARRLGMTMPTVSRHLSTWRELGFVDKPAGQETYRLGTKLFGLGQAAAEQNTHMSTAYPYLANLSESARETTIFATRVQDQAIVLACLDSGRPTTIVVRPGTVLRLPYSPSARVLWAFTPEAREQLEKLARRLDYSEQPRFNAEGFKRRMKQAVVNFFDYEVEVRRDGFGGLASPVFDHGNDVVASVGLLLPTASMSDPPPQALVQKLKDCAERISTALGATAWRR